MDSQATALVEAQGGVIGAGQLARLGIPAYDVQSWVARGYLRRVRRGAFVAGRRWDDADGDEQYRLTVMAVMRSRLDGTAGAVEAASHQAALALHRLPLWHVDRRLVVLSGDVQQSTTLAGLRVMPLRSMASVVEVDGLPTLALADAVVTTGSGSVEAGVVAADAALHGQAATTDDLRAAADRLLPGLRGRARVRRVLAAMDPLAESPGESRTRLVLSALGLPVESQVVVRDEQGGFVGRVDFLVAGRVVVEFDGAVKYGGADGRDGLVAEKRREDRLRSLGYEVVRLTWADLAHPARMLAQIRAALLRRAA
ncbi:type IV toxin-antitoxin system AbiEi family antitoxin domain-containing protein [Phycicoccus sp. Root101]|uniref:type IV toxin-antitoxin system AbiEi family antitoxin domain-containing protein n=1 Tax=Phycicoccus sp. Root101 TaxID=1736421 RepID=UPI000702FC7C|nr:type IV toxin-antitoxin system AbiEi family antitoxin domain-containing protein [Phycicoccus sp. Root101]KQU67528.1 hypothetical protein ASC58_13335 [Phycicoccus sp. Root101]